jgi:hypothetical protein
MNETMNATVQALSVDCLNCNEAIFNPICPSCIFREFENWIIKFPEIEEKVMKEVRSFLRNNHNLEKDAQTCIVCHNKRAYLCPYCSTEFLFNLLRHKKVSKKVLKEFFTHFNFDFEHCGYYREAEKLSLV